MKRALSALFAIAATAAWAGGSNHGVAPGANPNFTGKVIEWPVPTPKFARDPAIAPDGSVFITVMRGNKKEYQLPHDDAGAYAVNTDGTAMVWVDEINTDTVVRFDPKSDQMRVVKLPSTGVGIRKMAVDAQGKLWYVGSHNDRLDVI